MRAGRVLTTTKRRSKGVGVESASREYFVDDTTRLSAESNESTKRGDKIRVTTWMTTARYAMEALRYREL